MPVSSANTPGAIPGRRASRPVGAIPGSQPLNVRPTEDRWVGTCAGS